MSRLPNFLRSILLAGIFSFTLPIVAVGGVWGSLLLVGSIPQLAIVRRWGGEPIDRFLSVFGSGNALRGLLIIGCVCSLVGVLFDTYTFYRHQYWSDG